jgi:hypothetical protein
MRELHRIHSVNKTLRDWIYIPAFITWIFVQRFSVLLAHDGTNNFHASHWACTIGRCVDHQILRVQGNTKFLTTSSTSSSILHVEQQQNTKQQWKKMLRNNKENDRHIMKQSIVGTLDLLPSSRGGATATMAATKTITSRQYQIIK